MFFCSEHVAEADPHCCSAAQFCLREIRAPGRVDSLYDVAVQLVELLFTGRDAALRRPVGAARRPYQTLLLGRAAAARGYTLLALATRDNEMIVIAVASPGTRRHIPNFNKLPVGHISRR